MLEHLSPKFKMPPMEREPRAALILNRFTRNLSIMFATNAVSTILGLQPEEIKDKSFYECIQENCLQDAIQCLESAKANESIAYLRFSFRDPRTDDADEDLDQVHGVEDEAEEEDEEDDDDDSNANTELVDQMDTDEDEAPVRIKTEDDVMTDDGKPSTLSGFRSSFRHTKAHTFPYSQRPRTYRTPRATQFSATTPPHATPELSQRGRRRGISRDPPESFELEAVVSCTSDGLVVVLRKARPPIPAPHPPLVPTLNFENGLFAAPWGQQPIHPYFPPDLLYTFRPPLLPQYMPLRENVKAAGGPPLDQLMRSIRDVAVFAWALVGINGNLATYAHGLPKAGTRPAVDGLAGWNATTGSTSRRPSFDGVEQQCWMQPDNQCNQSRIGSRCESLLYPTPGRVSRGYNPTGQQQPPEHQVYNNTSSWPSSMFDASCYEQEQSQYEHTQNQFFQNTTQHHHYHHHHYHHYHEQQQLPAQQQPFMARESWAEAPSSRDSTSQGQPIPSAQLPRRNYSANDFRYMWQ